MTDREGGSSDVHMGGPTTHLTATDMHWLGETLELAARGGHSVPPDPFVGAVVVARDGSSVLGRGHHPFSGGTHAEPLALREAGDRARGSTLYCNLEPCGYDAPEKRQPACAAAVIDAGVARVVFGQADPHRRVRGGGMRRLRAAGLVVDVAPDPLPFWRANPVFTTTRTLGRPFIHVVTGQPTLGEDPRFRPSLTLTTSRLDWPLSDVDSILLRSDDLSDIVLPDGWAIDYIDGEPTAGWATALREMMRAEHWP